MKTRHLLALGAAMTGLLPVAATGADAQQRVAAGGPRVTVPSHSNHFSWERRRGFHGRHAFGGFISVEREVPVIVEREVVVREVAAEPPAPPAAPRKPYVIGRQYASLPGGCMKMIEGGASYYYCGSGEWYRPVGNQYRAVREP